LFSFPPHSCLFLVDMSKYFSPWSIFPPSFKLQARDYIFSAILLIFFRLRLTTTFQPFPENILHLIRDKEMSNADMPPQICNLWPSCHSKLVTSNHKLSLSTNIFMEQSPWDTDKCSVGQEVTPFIKPKSILFCFYMLQLDPIQSVRNLLVELKNTALQFNFVLLHANSSSN
jgi:hypothetical protein